MPPPECAPENRPVAAEAVCPAFARGAVEPVCDPFDRAEWAPDFAEPEADFVGAEPDFPDDDPTDFAVDGLAPGRGDDC